MKVNVRLNGISFAELPHLEKGDDVYIVREQGEIWDSHQRPAYSVRMGVGYSLGYIPLIETVKEEALKAKDGWCKVYKDEYEGLTKEQLREVARRLNAEGVLETFSTWKHVGRDNTYEIYKRKIKECETLEVVRDFLYVEIMRNHFTPTGVLANPVYFDKQAGRNLDGIGDVCSVSIFIDPDGGVYNPLATATGAACEAQKMADRD